MKLGTQIAYIPNHVRYSDNDKNKFNHSDTEYGFVTSINVNGTIFCRFWRKGSRTELRTTANSEGCNKDDLYECPNYVDQEIINKFLVSLNYYPLPIGLQLKQ